MNLIWLANIIVHHPYIILTATAVFSGACIIIPFTLTSMAIPKFQDPQMGFATRGTEIADRLTTWTNLIKELSPTGDFAMNPKELMEIKNYNQTVTNVLPTPSNKLSKKRGNKNKKGKSGPVYGNISLKEAWNSTAVIDDLNRWKLLHHLKPNPNRLRWKIPEDYFCGSPDEAYAHLVVTSHNSDDLFTISNVLAMCRLEHEFIGLKHYEDFCIHNTKGKNNYCCRPWSLPNYIAILNDRTSCLSITEQDIVNTKKLLKKCAPHFHNSTIGPECVNDSRECEAPLECVQQNSVYNIMHFLTSTSFLPTNKTEERTKLAEAMIFLPLASGIGILPYYHELQNKKLEYDGVKVVAMEFGLKSALFDEYLIRDTWLMGTGALFVFACMWIYTRSLFLTIMTIFIVVFSLAISYFMYFLVFEIKFFPFMNLLATVVAIGIGCDDVFIFCKIWNIHKKDQDITLLKVMTDTLHHAFISMFVTAATTAVAFLGSYVSTITAISCFSIFAGTAVIVNYALMMTWFPACMVIWERSCFSNTDLFRSCAMACYQRWCCFKSQWNLSTTWFNWSSFDNIWRATQDYIIDLIIKKKYFWCILFTAITLISGGIIFLYPRLELPNTQEFQLFASSHPFEQYDFYYKNLFWFKHPERGIDRANKLPLRFVWGVLPVDNGDYLDPSNLGSLVLDPTFDMAAPESQEWLRDFCIDLRQQPFYHSMVGALLPNCFIETFAKSMRRKCYDSIQDRDRTPCCEISEFPFNRSVFNECIIDEMAEIYQTPASFLNSGVAGPKFSKDQNPTIKAVIVEYDSSYSYSMSFGQMHEFFTRVEDWMTEILKSAPKAMKNGFFISELDFYDLQQQLSASTKTAIAISMALALIVLFLSTLNLLTSVYAVMSISSSIFVTMAALVLFGWKLNILESVAISTAIGLTVDFSLHYSVNYRLCPQHLANDREAATRHALSYMAGPAFMAALTTAAAGAFMLPSSILPYIQIGTFLVLVMCISWLYATFLLGSLLAIAGPVNDCGQFTYSNMICCYIKAKLGREGPLPPPSNLSDSHELESLTFMKRGKQTPRPLRRSLSSGGARFTPSKHMCTDQSPSAASAITIIMEDDN